jgi:hypothetical protein
MARLNCLLPRAVALSRALSGTPKRPPTFIQGDRLLPEEIKPWKGSGTVPIRVAPQGLGILQVISQDMVLQYFSAVRAFLVVEIRTHQPITASNCKIK